MAAIVTKDLALLPAKHRPRHVLAEIDMQVPVGACLGLLGGNGAGKSSLIKLLLGLVPIGAGTARLFEKAVPTPASRHGVGYLPEQAAPFANLTGREHLSLFGTLEGLSGDRLVQVVEAALERASLAEAADLVTSRYSKGMKQKLELERLLMIERRLLMLDEPLTGLDIESQLDFVERLRRLKDQGITIVITSHDPQLLEGVCSHFAVLVRGRLERFGAREEVLSQQGWCIEFEDHCQLPSSLPPEAEVLSDAHALLFRDREQAEKMLATYAGTMQVKRFGTKLRGVEDLLREVVSR